MRMKYKVIFSICFLMVLFSVLGIASNAATYEPDGSSSTVYECNKSDVNRTLVVKCVDEKGNLVKKVTFKCKYGEEGLVDLGVYGYDIVAFESNQGLLETCKLTWCSGTDLCTHAYIQIKYNFRTSLSKEKITATVTLRRSEKIKLITRYYVQKIDSTNASKQSYELHSSVTKTVDYYDEISTSAKTITGYKLKEGYESKIAGNLSYTWVGKYKNTPSKPRTYDYDFISTDTSDDMDEWTSYDEDKQGKLSYCINRVYYIDYYYDLEQYIITYDANGGSGAPSSQIKYYNTDIAIPDTVPTRSGYTFKGWGTSSTSTSVSYLPGGKYTSNTSRTLYAIWQSNAPKTYTVSYNANGGTGAPSSQTKTQGVTLTLSSVQPTRSGYTFLGWGTSSASTSATYLAGGSYTSNSSVTLYAVWSCDHDSTTLEYVTGCDWEYICDTCGVVTSTGTTHGPYTYGSWNYYSTSLHRRTKECNYGDYSDYEYSSHSKTTKYEQYSSSQHKYYSYCSTCVSTVGSVSYEAHNFKTTTSDGKIISVCNDCGYTKETVQTYTVSYNANGGVGAPTSQTKTYGVSLTLSSTIPTRSGYDFLGWSTSSTATSATYAAGDSYTANASVTLYAVWNETNYDFSISNLTVSNSEPYKYDQITVKVRTDSWDQVNAYSDIPVQLYYDGRLVSTQYVDFSVYGVANITFTLNVGSFVGDKTIEARINWADHNSETRTGNNTVSTSINVQDYDYEVTADPVSMAGYYCEGMEVISSFYVANNSDYDIIPSMHNTARFTAYYYNGSQKVVISTQDWDDVVIPAAGTNLIYFKWTVPTGFNGKTVYLECTVNADRYMNETNYDNNTASFSRIVSKTAYFQTPDTRFENKAPSSYQNVSEPSVSTDRVIWTRWEYENGSFVLKRYGVQISSVSPVVTPSADCVTAVYENGKWTMRSGYGITISYVPTISTVSGYERPDSNAYTSVQYVVATFPEFRYFDTDGNCRTLQYVNGSYQFVQNSDADGNARVHFIPVYVRDGNYTVSVTATHVWTPAGMIEATRSANIIIIDGTIYDDWYQG